VENLLTLARVEAGKCAVQSEPIELSEIIRNTWRRFAEPAATRNLSATFQMDDATEIPCDREKLELVLRNLFDNAVCYASPGSQIQIGCHKKGSEVVGISINNTISGLGRSDLDHLFDRFWRADSSRSQTGQHSGLGLPLCRSLIELMGGSIHARMPGSQQFAIYVELPARGNNGQETVQVPCPALELG
jgi:two-component system sensor histidine kinase ResE